MRSKYLNLGRAWRLGCQRDPLVEKKKVLVYRTNALNMYRFSFLTLRQTRFQFRF